MSGLIVPRLLCRETILITPKFASVYMIRRTSLANVEDRKPGRPPKQPADTTKQLNEAFRKATDEQPGTRKASKK